MSEHGGLNILKASAGSGKTHRLTGEYIRLLFAKPHNYRHILAVTFTNKATEEMKGRIILELNRLAKGASSDYLTDLITVSPFATEAAVREEARRLLVSILHDYSAFSITTIDRFFQQTVRSFTREIGLEGGYSVTLDTNDVLQQSIDKFLFEIDETENPDTLNWLIDFAEARIEEGGSWNIQGSIARLSEELLKESYKKHAKELFIKLADKPFLAHYHTQLKKIQFDYESRLKQLGQAGVAILHAADLHPDDSSYKWMNVFAQVAQFDLPKSKVRLLAMAENSDKWVAKKAKPELKEAASRAFQQGLNNVLCQILDSMDDNADYVTSVEISRQFYSLGILFDIDKTMHEFTKENGMLLISDTNELLSKIIGGSDIPFIYEKVGTRYHHYMIDEFQDTSGMQWNNFSPLIENSLAERRRNLIVGDVKQSIYRWRNSDWKLLGEDLERTIDPVKRTTETLQTNWRSSAKVVCFNNTFFTSAARTLQGLYNDKATPLSSDRIVGAYADVCQLASPKLADRNEGCVSIAFVDRDKSSDSKWQEAALERMILHLERVQQQGYTLRDIGILVRSKAEGNLVAQRLLMAKAAPDSRYNYEFISDEALFVANSSAVCVLLAVLTWFSRPNDILLRMELGELLTPERASGLEIIRHLPLYEMTEEIIRLFRLNEATPDSVYVQAFQDAMMEFTQANTPDPGLFLDWWAKSGVKKTIATPPAQEAIQILTIHKSKGLEFKIVLLPFCDWALDHKPQFTNILWCEPLQSPFNQMPLVPVKYGQSLLNSHFKAEYLEELLQVYIDNLNLAYVAFTRAQDELILITPRDEKSSSITSFASLLRVAMEAVQSAAPWRIEPDEWTLGEYTLAVPKQTDSSAYLPDNQQLFVYHTQPIGERLKLHLKGKGFFNDRKERQYGNAMHDLLSRITTTADLTAALNEARMSGTLTAEEQPLLHSRLMNAIESSALTASWFRPEQRVLNEVQILQSSLRFYRPDRVMMSNDQITVVDYKFGKIEDPSHIRQVERYVAIIGKMGYDRPIRGYLWYVELNKVVDVV